MTRFKGKPTGSKRVAWCEPLRLAEVKAVSRALGCTVNDILLSCVAGAMRRYLADKGDSTKGVEIRAIVPIDLRKPGNSALGNLLRAARGRAACWRRASDRSG